MKFITSAVRKGRKSYQEDRHCYLNIHGRNLNGWLLAVMDGHRGDFVAEFCRTEIPKIFRLSEASQGEKALEELVTELSRQTAHDNSGSTLSLALVIDRPRIASVAILGDSPVVIYDGKKLHLSPDHNVRTNLVERAAAEVRGGRYDTRDGGYLYGLHYDLSLQMGRALGDAWMGPALSHIPDIYTIKNPRWVLVASDGLFDDTHRDTERLLLQVKDLARQKSSAKDLMQWAESRGPLRDNATALVWHA
ncbi:MAG: PP2C family serine/threonine-protein phosphatase [bacterium]|nr:PP2C family serine/threonine-protein phosphatase [bacterium]